MLNFTDKRREMFEKKMQKTLKLITEMEASLRPCCMGNYKAKDTRRIVNMRAALGDLSNMYNIGKLSMEKLNHE